MKTHPSFRSIGFFCAAGLLAAGALAQEPQERPRQEHERPHEMRASQPQSGERYYKSDTLIGKDIQGRDGEAIGGIEQLILTPDGRAVYAIVSVGGVLGVGDHEVLIPWDAIQIRGEELAIDRTAEELEQLPEFDDEMWDAKDFAAYDRALGTQTAQERMPSLERAEARPERRDAPQRTPSEQQERQSAEQRERQQAQQQERQSAEQRERQQTQQQRATAGQEDSDRLDAKSAEELYVSGKQTQIEGEVVRLEENARILGLEPATVAHVETAEGKSMKVYLAPASHLEQKGIELEQGMSLQLKGAQVEAEGESVLLAGELTVDGKQHKLRDSRGNPVSEESRNEK